MNVKISIIFVSFNSQEFLLNCLQSLYSSSSEYDSCFETIVIDNNSSDESCRIVRKNFPNVVLIENNVNIGFGRANNLAVKQAKGDYILLMNPDTVVEGNIIHETLKFFDCNSDNKSAFGGMLLNFDRSEQRGSRRSFPTLINAVLHFTKIYKKIQYTKSYDLSWLPVETHQVDCVSGACFAMPKKMYEALGGFDEHFFYILKILIYVKEFGKVATNYGFTLKLNYFIQKVVARLHPNKLKFKLISGF